MNTLSFASSEPLTQPTLGNVHAQQSAAPRISPFRTRGTLPSARHESQFFTDLLAFESPSSAQEATPRRGTISVMMSALRGGSSVADVLDLARGVSGKELYAAYQYVDARRADSVDAFDELQTIPIVEHFHQLEDRLRPLFPHLCQRLRQAADVPERDFFAVVDEVSRQSRAMEHTVHWVEEAYRTGSSSDLSAMYSLDDGRGAGVFHHPSFRPRRIGEIVPDRLSSLLGESLSEPAE